tara:strand:- start:29 stop:760 length:732 start_codon:yes stop_codon:yes gene_type:complete
LKNIFVKGDSRQLIKKLDDNSIDLIHMDPPYVTTKFHWDHTEMIDTEFVNELFRVLKPTGSLYCWCGIGEKGNSLMRWHPQFSKKFFFKDLITWKKRRGIGMRKGWLYTREEIMWFVKDNKQFIWDKAHQYTDEPNSFKKGFKGTKVHPFKRITNVWTDVPEILNRRDKKTSHATPKPIKAIERIIKCHTKKGDLIFDPFAGSGSTLHAAENLQRNYIGIELDGNIFEETKKTLKEHINELDD